MPFRLWLRRIPMRVCRLLIGWVSMCLITTACHVATVKPLEKPALPDWQRPSTDNTAKRNLAANLSASESVWRRFGNAELNQLIDGGKADNADVNIALQRVAQTNAAYTGSAASLWPQVDVGVQTTRSHREDESGTGDSQNAGVGVAYEIDVWQRLANNTKAARYREDVSRFDLLAVQQLVSAAIAENYVTALALKDRIRIARTNLILLHEVLVIVTARVEAGADSVLELSQQQAETARAEATLFALQLQLTTLLHNLAVLTGKVPQTFAIRGDGFATLQTPLLNSVAPNELLNRRPDILAVEASVAAARLDIAVARAALYPDLRVGGLSLLKNPYNAPSQWVGSVFGALSATVFDGGALRASRWHRQRRSTANYWPNTGAW